MINIPPIKSSSPIKPELLAEVSRSWRVGQVLNATTQQGGEALSRVLLQVGNHTLEAKTPISLQTGQEIKLLVKSLGEIQTDSKGNIKSSQLPLLNIISPDTTAKGKPLNALAQTNDINTIATNKLRQFIAAQQSFSQLQTLSQALLTDANRQMLSRPLRLWLSNLQSSMQLNSQNLSAAQFKQQLLNSGVFLESKLHNQGEASRLVSSNNKGLSADFKFQLLAIKSELGKAQIPSPVQEITPQQLNLLTTNIKNSSSTPLELVNKLLSSLPKPLVSQLVQLLSPASPADNINSDLKLLAQAIIQATQASPQTSQKHLSEQLKFKLLLLDLGQQIEQSINKITSLQLQPLSREGDGLVLLLFNLVFKDNNEHFDISFRIQEEEDSTTEEQKSWVVTLNFNFKTLGIVQSKIHLIDDQVSTIFYTELTSTAEKIKPLLPLLINGLKNSGLGILNIDIVQGLMDEKPLVNEHVNLLDENA